MPGSTPEGKAPPGKAEPEPGLARTMGLFGLVSYGVGDMLGAGIYGLVGEAAKVLGNAIWLAFVVSMFAAMMTGLSYASLGSRYPRAAGAAYVVGRAFRRAPLAYVLGLAVLASGMTSMATAARVFSGYFVALAPSAPAALLPSAFVLLLALVTMRGLRESTFLNVVCTTVEVGGLVFVVAVGARFLGGVDYLDARSLDRPGGGLGPGVVLSGAVLTFYSFVGFEDMLNVSEEVKNPRRTFPLAVVLALAVTTLVYLAISLTAISVVPQAELAVSSSPLVDVAVRAAPWLPAWAFPAVALFAVTNTALLNFVMGSRLVYGMARQGLLPAWLGHVLPRRRTPARAAAVIAALVLALALAGDISALARSTSVLLLFVFVLVNASLVVLKARPSEPKGAFEVPALVPLLGIVVCLLLLAHAERRELAIAGALLAAAALLYAVVRPRGSAEAMGGEDGAG